ncbi:MAG: hypothetical protein V4662_15850 [Verrucomicrobiota bacterium]
MKYDVYPILPAELRRCLERLNRVAVEMTLNNESERKALEPEALKLLDQAVAQCPPTIPLEEVTEPADIARAAFKILSQKSDARPPEAGYCRTCGRRLGSIELHGKVTFSGWCVICTESCHTPLREMESVMEGYTKACHQWWKETVTQTVHDQAARRADKELDANRGALQRFLDWLQAP